MRRSLPLFIAAGLAVVTIIFAALGFAADADSRRASRDDAADQTLRAAHSVTAGLAHGVRSVRSLFASSEGVTEAEFETFTRPLLAAGGVTALGWAQVVPHAERAAFERRHGGPIRRPDGRPASPARSHAVVTYVRPTPFRTAGLLLDIGQDPEQAASLRRAGRTGRAVATPPMHGIPVVAGSFLLYLPAYRGVAEPATPAERERRLAGFAAGAFRFADLTRELRNAVPAGTSIAITTAGETVVRVGDLGADPAHRRLQFAGQVWDIRVTSAPGSGLGLGMVALLLGAVVIVLVPLLTRQAVRSENRARELVALRERERDLAQEARELSEAVSRSAQERFRRAFDDAPIGMALADGRGRVLDVNEALSGILGLTPQEMVGRNAAEFIHPDDEPELQEHSRALLEDGTRRVSWAARCLHADGHPVWVGVHATALGDAGDGRDRFLAQLQDITDRRRFEEQLRQLADHDPLTGLENRRAFGRAVDAHQAEVRRYGARGALIVLDVDHFKAVNDTLGHHAGDELIVAIADILRSQVRESDRIARLGGDEFAVLLPRADAAQAAVVAGKLVRAVREHRRERGGRVGATTISAGVAVCDGTRATGEQLFVDADLAMYDAKEAGRDGFAVFEDTDRGASQTKARLAWLDRISTALAEDRFTLVAQPILDLSSGRVVHHELLLRMISEEDGRHIAPAAFLEIAERFGLVTDIDVWVVREAIRSLAEHRDEDLVLEVNLSGSSMGDDRLLAVIETDLAATGVDPRRLIFEVTETAAVSNIPRARAFAERLAHLGCRFALDDFGAGFGSFLYLKHLPFDFLKIDGEFVRNCVDNHADRVIVSSLVRVATGLAKATIAEFVDDESTITLLRDLGVDLAQGYAIGRPAPLEHWLAGLQDTAAGVV